MRQDVRLWVRRLYERLAGGPLSAICFRHGAIALCALLAGALYGCAAVPQREFAAYKSAFDHARIAAQEVLLDYSQAKEELAKRQAAKQAKKDGSPRPALTYQFNYQTAISRSATRADGIAERMRALETMARYNQLLADLAEGKSAEQAASSAGQLVATISTFTNLVPGVGPLVSNFVMALERARSREEFVTVARAGEPIVVAVLDFFMTDVPDYYVVRRDLTLLELEATFDRIDERIDGLEQAAKGMDPAAKVDLSPYEKQINEDLTRMAKTRRTAFSPAAKPPATPVATQDALVRSYFAQSTLAVTADIQHYLSVSEKLNAYLVLLQRYEVMLDATKRAMIALRIAVDAPQDVVSQFEDLLHTTLLLRRDFMKFRGQL